MNESNHPNILLSAFCSLMIGSTVLTSAARPYQEAGVASDGLRAKEIEALKSFAKDGWTLPEVSNIPSSGAIMPKHATPAKVQAASESGPLSALAEYVLANGQDATIGSGLGTWLGLANDENGPKVPCKQFKINGDVYSQAVDVVTTDQGLAIVIDLRKRDLTDAWLYRTTISGDLISSVHAGKYDRPPLRRIPSSEGNQMFEREKSFWVERVASGQVAQQ